MLLSTSPGLNGSLSPAVKRRASACAFRVRSPQFKTGAGLGSGRPVPHAGPRLRGFARCGLSRGAVTVAFDTSSLLTFKSAAGPRLNRWHALGVNSLSSRRLEGARLDSHGGERPPVVVRIDFASRPDAMPSSRPELRRLAPPLRGCPHSRRRAVVLHLHGIYAGSAGMPRRSRAS